jgi:hypothetical protein
MAPRKRLTNALVVKTFAYPTTAFGSGPDDPGVRPLEGVEVAIKQGPAGPKIPPLPGPKPTGADGKVEFENLPEGTNYLISVTVPTGYEPPQADLAVFINGRKKKIADQFLMKEGGEVLVEVGLVPKPGEVKGIVRVVDAKGEVSGVKLNDIRVEARNGGLLIDSDVTAKGMPMIAKAGAFKLIIDQPGLIEIIPASSFVDGGRTYVPQPGNANRFVRVEPGDKVDEIIIDYRAARAEIVVGAQFVDNGTDQPERRPLDGVTFRLFPLGQDLPLFEQTTQAQLTCVFSDLAKGAYRVVAQPPQAANGQRLQLTRPSTGEISLEVDEGQRIDLSEEFEFQPTLGSALGSVVLARDDTPVPAVAVVLTSRQQPQVVRRVRTEADGEYRADDLPPGVYRVALELSVVTAFGRRWEEEPTSGQTDPARTIEVRPRTTTFVPQFRLVEEEHLISGQVFGSGGAGAPFVIVQIFADANPLSQPLENVLTDQNGFYQFRAPTAGTFFIRVREENGIAPQLTPVTVNSPTTAPPLFASTRPQASHGNGESGTTGSAPVFSDNDFPFLTEEVDLAGRGGARQPSGGGATAVGRIVERELREILGWRPRSNDPKGFQAALQQAFTITELAGHTEVTWKPRTYSVEIQADLGAITGAQASLYTRAKGTLDQVLPLLDGLAPLRTDFDAENVEAAKAIVRSQLSELVAELGVEGGPRVQRVDQLFTFLLGETQTNLLGGTQTNAVARPDRSVQRDPDAVGGGLGGLRDRLGLDRDRINTIDEEHGFTNFLVVLDQVVGLAESWDTQRQFFVRGGAVEPFLGTQLVLLSRDLEVIAESVHEVEFAMDSVFLGPAERQTLELRFPGAPTRPLVAGSPPMFVSELLSWVERFATEEGRQLIQDGGRQGVVAFRPTIELLQALVEAALVAPAGLQDPFRMPAAYRRQRVQRALAELAQQLDNAAERIELIRAPIDDGAAQQTPQPATNPQSSVTDAGRPRRKPSAAAPDNGRPDKSQTNDGSPIN